MCYLSNLEDGNVGILHGFVVMCAGLKRCGKSCRLRWLNYLRPDIKRGNISPGEEDLIIRLHKLLGNRSVIIFLTYNGDSVADAGFVFTADAHLLNNKKERKKDADP